MSTIPSTSSAPSTTKRRRMRGWRDTWSTTSTRRSTTLAGSSQTLRGSLASVPSLRERGVLVMSSHDLHVSSMSSCPSFQAVHNLIPLLLPQAQLSGVWARQELLFHLYLQPRGPAHQAGRVLCTQQHEGQARRKKYIPFEKHDYRNIWRLNANSTLNSKFDLKIPFFILEFYVSLWTFLPL